MYGTRLRHSRHSPLASLPAAAAAVLSAAAAAAGPASEFRVQSSQIKRVSIAFMISSIDSFDDAAFIEVLADFCLSARIA